MITLREYYEKHHTNKKPKTKEQKVADYISARIDDLETDFIDDEDDVIEEYWNTVLSENAIKNMERACTEFFNTMLSSDLDYLINGDYSWEEIVELVTTE